MEQLLENNKSEAIQKDTSVIVSPDLQSVAPGNTLSTELLAPMPLTIEDTGLPTSFLIELISRHLYDYGDLDLKHLSQSLALSWQITEQLLTTMKKNSQVEVKGSTSNDVRYGLTKPGFDLAIQARNKSTYSGPAPITLEQYRKITRHQNFSNHDINESVMKNAYSDVVVIDELFSILGPAILSGKSMIFYGSPGTGKTYIAQRIARVFADSIIIPHSILVAGKIVQIFDPVFHEAIPVKEDTLSLMLTSKEDPRFVRCKRPSIVTGGELTMEMLEVEHDATTNTYHAPTHIKANNGVFIVDDLGRQRVKPKELLNRWIIPLQERRDFMTVGSGSRFEVPMEMIIAFSTNLDPKELADDAFLRRLGYKIKFSPFPTHEYIKLWQQTCESYNTQFDEEIVNFLIEELYTKDNVPLIPCHPKELISLVNDQCRYEGSELNITKENLTRAWKSFFVSSN